MLVLLGKTASGKSAIADKLVNEYGYKKIVTYTTRPKRAGEVDGKDYHFIDKKTFFDMIYNEEFMEYKSYTTIFGDWYYGSVKEDYINVNKRTVVILTPEGYIDFLDLSIPHTSILIQTNRFITRHRLKRRGDDNKEIKRRMEHDNIDFLGCNDLVDYVINNNGSSEKDLDNVVNKVFKKHMEGGNS